MNILSITNEANEILVSVQIGDIDPATATVAILSALAAIPKPRTKRGRVSGCPACRREEKKRKALLA